MLECRKAYIVTCSGSCPAAFAARANGRVWSDFFQDARLGLSSNGAVAGRSSVRVRSFLAKGAGIGTGRRRTAFTPLPLLSHRELRKWRDGLAKQLAASSVNRTATGLKATFNLAADNDERIANRRAWETGLATIPDAEQSRNVILPDAAVRQIVSAAYDQGSEFGLLIEVAAVTGARTLPACPPRSSGFAGERFRSTVDDADLVQCDRLFQQCNREVPANSADECRPCALVYSHQGWSWSAHGVQSKPRNTNAYCAAVASAGRRAG